MEDNEEITPVWTEQMQVDFDRLAVLFGNFADAVEDVMEQLVFSWNEKIVPAFKEVYKKIVTTIRYCQRVKLSILIIDFWPTIPDPLLNWLVEIWPERFLPGLA